MARASSPRVGRSVPVALALATVLVLSGVGVGPAVGESGGSAVDAATVGSTAGTLSASEPDDDLACPPSQGRPDPASDRLGWEDGCWYDESIDIDHTDGLNESELRIFAARTKARLEVIRGLEFTDPVTVDLVPRSTLDPGGRNRTPPTARRLRANLRYEALFLVPESTDVLGGGGGGGAPSFRAFYAPWDERVVIITEGNATDRLYAPLLAHELMHALQDDHYESARPVGWDRQRARRALVEGEAAFVVQTYRERCEGPWAGTCILPPEDGDGGGGGGNAGDRFCAAEDPRFNWGRHLINIFPYSDGPVFVETLYERGGWDAVRAAFEDPPRSTTQVIHPERYGTDPPRNVTLEDISTRAWEPVEPPRARNPTGMQTGESAIYAMLWAQWWATDHRVEIIPCESTFETDNPRDKFDYDHPVTEGFDGDRLIPYRPNGSADLEDLGYVWKTTWESPEDAEAFAAAYRTMLEGHNATRLADHPRVLVVPDSSPYADAFYVERRGDVVLVVNAPTVGALSAIRPGVAEGVGSPTVAPAATSTPESTPTPAATGAPQAGGAGSRVPGFGFLAAVLGVVLAAVGLGIRRRCGGPGSG